MKKLLTLVLALSMSVASAKTISVSLPFPPGGATDRAWRVLHPMLGKELKNDDIELVTEYRPGGGGLVAGTHVANASDTQLLFTSASVMISLAQSDTLPYRPEDFQMLGYFGTLPMMFVVSPNGPNTMKEFIQLCRSKTMNMGSAGVGSTIHLVAESVMRNIRCNFVNVPYKGPGMIVPDLVANRIDFMVDYTASATYNIVKDGRLKNLMVMSTQRLADAPLVPTAHELGIDVEDLKNWQVFLINTKANSDDIAKISAAVKRVLSKQENLREFKDLGLDGAGTKVPATFLQDNYNFYRRYISK